MSNRATLRRSGSNDVPIDDHDAKIAFLHRMMPHWFMCPFATVAGGAIEHLSANEEQVILVLRRYVKSFSQKLYEIDPVREFGLIARRECRVCASSPDRVVSLKKRNQAGLHIFVGLCVLEIKTKASENTASDLAQQVMAEGRNFVVFNAGDEEFKQ